MQHDDSRVSRPTAPENVSRTLTVTLQHSRGALGRIAASLSSTSVTALSYAVADVARATAEIRVAQADVPRARARLNRMIDVVSVS
jgi:acetolactate synthase small subunit